MGGNVGASNGREGSSRGNWICLVVYFFKITLLTGVRGGYGDVPTCRFAGSSWQAEPHSHQIWLLWGHLPKVLVYLESYWKFGRWISHPLEMAVLLGHFENHQSLVTKPTLVIGSDLGRGEKSNHDISEEAKIKFLSGPCSTISREALLLNPMIWFLVEFFIISHFYGILIIVNDVHPKLIEEYIPLL